MLVLLQVYRRIMRTRFRHILACTLRFFATKNVGSFHKLWSVVVLKVAMRAIKPWSVWSCTYSGLLTADVFTLLVGYVLFVPIRICVIRAARRMQRQVNKGWATIWHWACANWSNRFFFEEQSRTSAWWSLGGRPLRVLAKLAVQSTS